MRFGVQAGGLEGTAVQRQDGRVPSWVPLKGCVQSANALRHAHMSPRTQEQWRGPSAYRYPTAQYPWASRGCVTSCLVTLRTSVMRVASRVMVRVAEGGCPLVVWARSRRPAPCSAAL